MVADAERVRVVIVGGGTAGWMAAAALATLAPTAASIHLVESAEIGIVGVGEATLPHLAAFIRRLGIDETAFMAATHATYKLGIEFRDFGHIGERYIHPFGSHGRAMAGVGFHHWWLHARSGGMPHPIDDFAMGAVAARANRFSPPPADGADDPLAGYGYAYQFDATRFAPFLRELAEARGASRSEGRVVSIERDDGDGRVTAVVLTDGQRIAGDLFLDCSGFRALLIGEEDSRWENWSQWLPCDRAVAVPCSAPAGPIESYTRATAMPAGWRWRIPLTHRIGNGYVYSSAYLSDAAAAEALLGSLEGEPLAEPRLLRFRAGRRTRSWAGNVVAIGLASGFLEPLESTSIYLVQMAITELLEHFPGRRPTDADRDGFNRQVDREYDRIRDFLILHYHATSRDDSAFWNHVRTMTVPDTLAEKMALWRHTARVAQYRNGLFLEPSWVAVYLGQGIVPDGWDPRVAMADPAGLARATDTLHRQIAAAAASMPDHATYLATRLPA